jgi:hypothetical protein
MTSLLGWVIIVLLFSSLGAVALYPGYRLARRSHARSVGLRGLYVAAALGCGLAIWLLLPLVVHRLFGHSAA